MTARTNIDPHGTNYTRLLFRATPQSLEKEGDVSQRADEPIERNDKIIASREV